MPLAKNIPLFVAGVASWGIAPAVRRRALLAPRYVSARKSPLANDAKYLGLDVHQATISAAVLDAAGNLVMEAILETKTETILQFMHGLRGSW